MEQNLADEKTQQKENEAKKIKEKDNQGKFVCVATSLHKNEGKYKSHR